MRDRHAEFEAGYMPGYTLTQCLVCVAILAVLAGLMAPDSGWLRVDRQGRSVLIQVAAIVALARVEAARHNAMATLCPSIDGRLCGGDWGDGILLFVDRDDDKAPGAGDDIVQHLQWERLVGRLHWRAFRSKPFLQITPVGFTRYQNGNFTWCDLRRTPGSARQLIVNYTGRVRFSRDTDGDGLHENSQGRPVSCPA